LDGGMNKYGDPSEKQKFQAWLTYVPSFKLTICVYPDVTIINDHMADCP
jgi:hypothetical protein